MSLRSLTKITLVGLALSTRLGCAPGRAVVIEPGHPTYVRIPAGHLRPEAWRVRDVRPARWFSGFM